MEYKTSHSPNETEQTYAFGKKFDQSEKFGKASALIIANSSEDKFAKLYETGVKISLEKYSDLISLLPYVPQALHEDFRMLPHEINPAENRTEIHPESYAIISVGPV